MAEYRRDWVRNGFHYLCDLNSTGAAGNFELSNPEMVEDSGGVTVTNGRVRLVGDGSTVPYLITPIPKRPTRTSDHQIGNGIFTAQVHIVFADSVGAESPTITAGDCIRVYILDQFKDWEEPLGYLEVQAGAVADPRDATVTVHGREDGAWNDVSYGDNFHIYNSTVGYLPVTVELRLDMNHAGKGQLNYTLAHCLGATDSWGAMGGGMDNMFELEEATDIDCDYRRPTYLGIRYMYWDAQEETYGAPAENDEIVIWGIHMAEDPHVVVGDRIGNMFMRGLALVSPDTSNPATTHAATRGKWHRHPVIGHAINKQMLMSDAGVSDGLASRLADLTWNQGYRKLIFFPTVNDELTTIGGLDRIDDIKASLTTVLAAIHAEKLDDVVIANINPDGESDGTGARLFEARQTVLVVNEWLKNQCLYYGFSYADIHRVLNHGDDDEEVDPAWDYYAADYTLGNGFPDLGLGWMPLKTEVVRQMNRGSKDHRRTRR